MTDVTDVVSQLLELPKNRFIASIAWDIILFLTCQHLQGDWPRIQSVFFSVLLDDAQSQQFRVVFAEGSSS